MSFEEQLEWLLNLNRNDAVWVGGCSIGSRGVYLVTNVTADIVELTDGRQFYRAGDEAGLRNLDDSTTWISNPNWYVKEINELLVRVGLLV